MLVLTVRESNSLSTGVRLWVRVSAVAWMMRTELLCFLSTLAMGRQQQQQQQQFTCVAPAESFMCGSSIDSKNPYPQKQTTLSTYGMNMAGVLKGQQTTEYSIIVHEKLTIIYQNSLALLFLQVSP